MNGKKKKKMHEIPNAKNESGRRGSACTECSGRGDRTHCGGPAGGSAFYRPGRAHCCPATAAAAVGGGGGGGNRPTRTAVVLRRRSPAYHHRFAAVEKTKQKKKSNVFTAYIAASAAHLPVGSGKTCPTDLYAGTRPRAHTRTLNTISAYVRVPRTRAPVILLFLFMLLYVRLECTRLQALGHTHAHARTHARTYARTHIRTVCTRCTSTHARGASDGRAHTIHSQTCLAVAFARAFAHTEKRYGQVNVRNPEAGRPRAPAGRHSCRCRSSVRTPLGILAIFRPNESNLRFFT